MKLTEFFDWMRARAVTSLIVTGGLVLAMGMSPIFTNGDLQWLVTP